MRYWILILFSIIPLFTVAQDYWEAGTASYYGDRVQGRGTASGEKYDKELYTAAHRTLPFNTMVRVTNVKNNKSVVVRIIDRGPHTKNRIIDLSKAAARDLDMLSEGIIWVTLEYAGTANGDSIKAIIEEKNRQIAEKRSNTNKTISKKAEKKPAEGELLPETFYDQDMVACKPMGYGIQVGYYKSLSNCRNDMHKYQALYNTGIYMHVEIKKSTKYYKLIIGQFANKTSASEMRDDVIRQMPSCFIVAYKDI